MVLELFSYQNMLFLVIALKMVIVMMVVTECIFCSEVAQSRLKYLPQQSAQKLKNDALARRKY